jgi:hypothetical protein
MSEVALYSWPRTAAAARVVHQRSVPARKVWVSELYRGTSPLRKRPTPYDPLITPGIISLRWGPTRVRFLMSEVPLHSWLRAATAARVVHQRKVWVFGL